MLCISTKTKRYMEITPKSEENRKGKVKDSETEERRYLWKSAVETKRYAKAAAEERKGLRRNESNR